MSVFCPFYILNDLISSKFYLTSNKKFVVISAENYLVFIELEKRLVVSKYSKKTFLPSQVRCIAYLFISCHEVIACLLQIEVGKEMIIFIDNESLKIWDKDNGVTDTLVPVRSIWYRDTLLDNKQIWVSGDGERVLVASIKGQGDEGTNVRAPLPLINLTVVLLDNLTNIPLDLIEFGGNFVDEFYISGVSWTPVDDVTITLTSRDQNVVTILICSSPGFSCRKVNYYS